VTCRYGGLLVIRGPTELSTGQLTAYILYVIYSVFSVTQLVATVNSNAAAAAAAARVNEILGRRSLASNDRGQTVTNFRGLIEFKNVRCVSRFRDEEV
jgi:ABC-type bacteriocin/lantibiotic exporter with double-glycine peptidase domain